MADPSMPADPTWTPLPLDWAQLQPIYQPLSAPVTVDLAEVPLYGFAAVSSPIGPTGDWLLRLHLGSSTASLRLVTANPGGERRQPRVLLPPSDAPRTVVALIDIPADYEDMCLIIQKMEAPGGSIVIHKVEISPAPGPALTR